MRLYSILQQPTYMRSSSKKRMLAFFSCIFLFIFTPLQANANRTYQVELIIFEHNLSPETLDELANTSVKIPNFSKAKNLIENGLPAMPGEISLLSPRSYRMTGIANKLENQPDYNIIAHLAWRQSISSPSRAKPIRISEGQYVDNTDSFNHTSRQSPLHRLDGTIILTLQRYIDLRADLILSIPNSNASNQGSAYTQVQMKQTERMRSNELHYFDTPAFGMLVKIYR